MEHKMILLELTRREAWALAAIFQHIGGAPDSTLRGSIDDIYDQLVAQSDIDPESVEFSYWVNNAVETKPYGLIFHTNSVPPLTGAV